jgi:hypothetical protein
MFYVFVSVCDPFTDSLVVMHARIYVKQYKSSSICWSLRTHVISQFISHLFNSVKFSLYLLILVSESAW